MEISRSLKFLENQLGLGRNSLCPCGRGSKYKDCCSSADEQQLSILEEFGVKVGRYITKAPVYTEATIPAGLLRKQRERITRLLGCAYLGCPVPTVKCHLIAETTLRKYFGNFCQIAMHQDGYSYEKFRTVGVGNAPAENVFCSEHDNYLFRKIDRYDIDFEDPESQFLLCFRAFAFSLRRHQYLLNFLFYSELERLRYVDDFSEFLSSARGIPRSAFPSKHFRQKYIRFDFKMRLFMRTLHALSSKDWSFFLHYSIKAHSDHKFFFSETTNTPDFLFQTIDKVDRAFRHFFILNTYPTDTHQILIYSYPRILCENDNIQQLVTTLGGATADQVILDANKDLTDGVCHGLILAPNQPITKEEEQIIMNHHINVRQEEEIGPAQERKPEKTIKFLTPEKTLESREK